MTTDELLEKLPKAIGNNTNDGMMFLVKETDQIEGLYLHYDGRDWVASYGTEGDYVCLNPEAEQPPYNNAVKYGSTPNEALQNLYNWCKDNNKL